MSKKDEELGMKIVFTILGFIVLSPILLIIGIVKLISMIPNRKLYNINISSDEQEQLNLIDNMTGIEFERFMAGILMKSGYKNVKVTKSSGDEGADILAEKDHIKYAIQCKRFNSKIGARPIGEVLRGINNYKCDKGIVITNNYFTKQAYNEAVKCNVELWDREKILLLYRDIVKKTANTSDKQINDNEKNDIIKKNVRTTIISLLIVSIIVIIGSVYAIKRNNSESISNQNEMISDKKDIISYYSFEDDIYKIIDNSIKERKYDDRLFVKKSHSDMDTCTIAYRVKSNIGNSKEEYEEFFHNEIEELYNNISDKKIRWRSIWGEEDCSHVTIKIWFEYESNINYSISNVVLKYSNDMWKQSYEDSKNKELISEEKYNEIAEYFKNRQ